MVSLTNIERLEKFWHRLVLTIPQAKTLKGAVVACYPEVPIPPSNHAADINVNKDEVEDLLNKVTGHFLSRGSPFVYFRISPLTRPRTFGSFLENHEFERESEDSVMVFNGKQVEDKLNPEVTVEKISESEIETYSKLILTIFEMPVDWKKGLNKLLFEWIRKNAKLY
jgi:GNAT superfamily N-acetyltransferase